MSAAFRNETWNPGPHHRVEPASGLNPADLVNGSFWNLRDVVVLAGALQSFCRGKDGRSTLDTPPKSPNIKPERNDSFRFFVSCAAAFSLEFKLKYDKTGACILRISIKSEI